MIIKLLNKFKIMLNICLLYLYTRYDCDTKSGYDTCDLLINVMINKYAK